MMSQSDKKTSNAAMSAILDFNFFFCLFFQTGQKSSKIDFKLRKVGEYMECKEKIRKY